MRYYSLINSMSRGGLTTNFLTGLVAYYSFDASNATDIHTGTHNGSISGSPTFPSGKNSNCIDFGNTDALNYVSIPDSNDFSFTNGTNDVPGAISLWAKNTDSSLTGNWLINKRTATSGGDEWQLIVFENRIQFVKFEYNNNAIIQITKTVVYFPIGVWYHILVTLDGTSAVGSTKIYLNGSLNVDLNFNNGGTYTRMNNGAKEVVMGINGWSPLQELKHRGSIDEVAFWKGVTFGSAEATALYNAGTGKFYNTF